MGDLKISWQYCPDGQNVSVIAQQIMNNIDQTTFRKWNPNNLTVGFGEDNSQQVELIYPDNCFCQV